MMTEFSFLGEQYYARVLHHSPVYRGPMALLHNICPGVDDIMTPEHEYEEDQDVAEDEEENGLEQSM